MNVVYFDGTAEGLAHAIQAAAAAVPQPLAEGEVRTMRAFAEELAVLIGDVVKQEA